MRRIAYLALALAAIGCGKSGPTYEQAAAAYQAELAGLERLEKERDEKQGERDRRSLSLERYAAASTGGIEAKSRLFELELAEATRKKKHDRGVALYNGEKAPSREEFDAQLKRENEEAMQKFLEEAKRDADRTVQNIADEKQAIADLESQLDDLDRQLDEQRGRLKKAEELKNRLDL